MEINCSVAAHPWVQIIVPPAALDQNLSFVSKAGISIEEADESIYWMEMLIESKVMPQDKLTSLLKEADEIVAILTASIKTARSNLR